MLLIHENAPEYIVCEMEAILFMGDKLIRTRGTYLNVKLIKNTAMIQEIIKINT